MKEIKTRNGQRYVDHLEDVVLREGDTLVVMADDTFIPTWGESSVFVLLTNGNDPDTSGKKKRWLALILLVLMIVGATVANCRQPKRCFPISAGYVFFVCITTIIMAWTNIFPPPVKYTKYISLGYSDYDCLRICHQQGYGELRCGRLCGRIYHRFE